MAAYFAGPDAPSPGRVAVVGCGRGHEVLMLAAAGHQAVGFDFAPEAVAAGRSAADEAGLAGRARFVEADIFELPGSEEAGRFDAVVEHTCYCAIDPARRADYRRSVDALLRPGGAFIGLFWHHGRPGGPPFSISPEHVRSEFGGLFAVSSLEPARGSTASRVNQEWLLVASKPVR